MNINMVVHVSRDKQDELILNKTVLNPLEWIWKEIDIFKFEFQNKLSYYNFYFYC